MGGESKPIEDRFWARLAVKGPDDCWLWQGYVNPEGYGMLARCGSAAGMEKIHRLSYKINVGPIPDGMYVCHRCDVRHCGNPAHLWLGTHLDNMRDRDSKGRNPIHAGIDNGNAKLTEANVLMIREMYKTGRFSRKDLAEIFRVSTDSIARIVTGNTWKNLPI